MMFSTLKRTLLLVSILGSCGPAFADDPGITKVRLIQETDTTYLFELDISAQYLWTIAPPTLPEGFRISDPEYEDQSGWITVKALISSTGSPFRPADKMILPWQRAGVDITVQWKDGHTFKGLYNRTLEGIHIPMGELMPVSLSTREVLTESFLTGLHHLPFSLAHPLLVLVLVWAFPSILVYRYLFMMTLGQLSALVLAELGMPAFDLLFSELLLILLVFLLSYAVAYRIRFRFLGLLLFLAGLLHALALTREPHVLALDPQQRIQALLAFNLAMDAGHYLLVSLLLWPVRALRRAVGQPSWTLVLQGVLAVFLVLHIFSNHILSGQTRILARDTGTDSFTYKTYAPQSQLTPGPAQRGKGMMTTPLMVFLSIKPHEVRQEILVLASEAIRYTASGNLVDTIIPVEAQEALKQDLQDTLSAANSIFVNNRPIRPDEIITSFVTLGRGGVALRETPVVEDLDEAILGLTFIYDLDAFPDSIRVNWTRFPESLPFIEASAVDPHGAFTTVLSPAENTLRWRNRLAGFQVPAIQSVLVERQALPLISILIWLVLLAVISPGVLRQRKISVKQWMAVALTLSLLAYPFLRLSVDLPFIPRGKPSPDKAETILSDLLSNTYRAFDRRDESEVYDLLAVSVSGEQLTKIYMQNRQSMTLANRGGARAIVDEVDIRELTGLKRLHEQAYMADTRWTVRGSVNHFGHTHYRQNLYRALVSFGTEGESWKIQHIEILDTRRIY
jgi:hypothetical protein